MAAPPFPLSPTPSYYATCSFSKRNGVYTVGDTVTVTLSKSGATAYTVRDWTGTTVGTGTVTGTTVTPVRTDGQPWKPGWYRLYLTQATNDAVFGISAGATNFLFMRGDSRFPDLPAPGPTGGAGGENRDLVLKGAMGIGTSRMSIGDVTALTTGSDTLAVVQTDVLLAKTYWSAPAASYVDSARPRPLWTNFPNGTTDSVTVGALRVYCKDETINGTTVSLTAAAGTSSGTKITVTAGTTETYDNLATATAAVTALSVSAYVRGFGSGALANIGATVIGNVRFGGVSTVVAALYPDVTRFEGPTNEPVLSAETAHQMRLFRGAVKAGNSNALAIGPCPVDIVNTATWTAFLDAGGGQWCDELSFHDYTTIIGSDLNLARTRIETFKALLATYGLAGKPLWQTEAGETAIAVAGVHAPRRARVGIMHTLLWEQYGIPRERNPRWYDRSHGFWSFPVWLEHGDTSAQPQVLLYRTLAEETFGMTHSTRLRFGQVGDKIFLGSIYTSGGASCAVLLSMSAMPNASLTFTVTGTAGPLTIVDSFGNTSTVTVASGRVTVPVADTPTYLRLPTGATITPYSCNDWPNLPGLGEAGRAAATVSGTITPAFVTNDQAWLSDWAGYAANPGLLISTAALPDTLTLKFPAGHRLDRIIIWSGIVRQQGSTLTDFDVQTSDDAVTWTTRATYTAGGTSFLHGSNSTNAGCQRETFWDEPWIFDVKLPAPVTCNYVRLYVRNTSYGGMPDTATGTVSNFGDGGTQALAVQEIVTLCDRNTQPQYVRN